MNIFNIITLFGGLALFLYGMRIMGDGLSKGSSDAFKRALNKVTNNPVVGFLVGALVTGIIQSSTATIVIVSGLVGAGLMTFKQSIGVMLGANVGTTITGQIIRLLDLNAGATSFLNFFKPSTLAPLAAIIGIIFIMFLKKQSGSGTIGQIAMGFGILFTGLMNMTAAVTPLSQEAWFTELFQSFSHNPLLGFLIGLATSFVLQSSSATVGILQALSTTGALTFGSVYSIIIGIFMGDCVTTAIVCSIGAKADAKRTGIAHILFNLFSCAVVTISVFVLHKTGVLNPIWSVPISSGGIANANTIFKVACAILIMPFVKFLEKATIAIVKDDKVDEKGDTYKDANLLDKALYRSPELAITGISSAMAKVINTATNNYHLAMSLVKEYSDETAKELNRGEEFIDFMTDHISSYLVSFPLDGSVNQNVISYNMKCVLEFERIGDLAQNLAENAEELHNKGMKFSEVAVRELDVLDEAITEVLTHATNSYLERTKQSALMIEPVEEVVDELVARLKARHINRLQTGECNVIVGSTFLDMLVNFERISDQCSNIGVYSLAVKDSEIASDQHSYLTKLHHGENAAYNDAFEAARKKYLSALNLAASDDNAALA